MASFPDIRESPDGANSSAIDATCKSSNGRASTSFDIDIADEFGSTYDEEYCRDIIMEFVQMDGQPPEQRSSVKSPFKKYTNKLKNKVIKDHIMNNRNAKDSLSSSLPGNQRLLPDRPRKGLKPVSVSRTRSRMATKQPKYTKSVQNLKVRSLSSDNIAPERVNNLSDSKGAGGIQPFSIRHSVERLPTLSKFDEERIVWLKNLEDDIQFTDERRKRTVLSRQKTEFIESSPSTSPSSDPPSSDPSTCVSMDNSPNVARKGGTGITGTIRSTLLANIRKDEIKMNNVSNLVNNVTTTLCKHPNQSQLNSMEHELAVNWPEIKTMSTYDTLEDKYVYENQKNEKHDFCPNNVLDDDESLADDITYNIVDIKPSKNIQVESEKEKYEYDTTNDVSNEPYINNNESMTMSQHEGLLDIQESVSNSNTNNTIKQKEELVVTQNSIQKIKNSFKNVESEKDTHAVPNLKSDPLETLENDNQVVEGNKDEVTTSFENGDEIDADLANLVENPIITDDLTQNKNEDHPMVKERKKSKHGKNQHSKQDISAECFIVSRGWQMDQNKLCRALDKIKGVNFSRVQTATTINRVIESIRPHQDAVVIHICSQELMEAAQSIISVPNTLDSVYVKHSQTGNLATGLSVVQSIATVLSRHIFTAAGQNRSTQFIISLPLPMTLIPLLPPNYEVTEKDVKNLCELRRSFNANLKSNLCKCPNVQCCDNENLASTMTTAALLNSITLTSGGSYKTNDETHSIDNGEKVESSKLLNDNNQLTSAGMKKLARNWEIYLTMVSKGKEGQLILRRPSEESSGSISNNNSDDAIDGGNRRTSTSGDSTGSDRSLDGRAPWKPY
jgi:hypothetical protein